METKTASSRMHSLVILYDMHTDFFNKAIEGIKTSRYESLIRNAKTFC